MASFWERQARKAKNIATNPLTYAGPAGWMAQAVDSATGGKVTDAGRDLVRDVPLLGSALNQESTAERIAREQSQAVSEAQQFQEQQYQQARGFLKPYYQMGSAAYRDMASGIRSGKYVQDPFGAPEGSEITNFTYNIDQPGAFDYSGIIPSELGYEGQQPGSFMYSGPGQSGSIDYQGVPMSELAYSGSPVDRSIESYMQDDPSLAWQQEQMEKAIDRNAAAQGRWGGGGTAREMMRETAGLLSQDYANRFARAQAERAAEVGAERDMYGRALTDFDIGRQAEQEQYGRALTGLNLANLAEQSQFDRALGKYGLDVGREQTAYDRALTDFDIARTGEQLDYDRSRALYDDELAREQLGYDRALNQYNLDRMAQDTMYQRGLGEYALGNERLQNMLAQDQFLAQMGPQMATVLANAAIGQGSTMADLAIQQGNIAAALQAAQGNQLGGLLDLIGKGASAYGAVSGM